MCVCRYICTCAVQIIYIYICIYVCVCVYSHITHTCVRMHARSRPRRDLGSLAEAPFHRIVAPRPKAASEAAARAYMKSRMYACTYVRNACVHVCMYKYIYIYTSAYCSRQEEDDALARDFLRAAVPLLAPGGVCHWRGP